MRSLNTMFTNLALRADNATRGTSRSHRALGVEGAGPVPRDSRNAGAPEESAGVCASGEHRELPSKHVNNGFVTNAVPRAAIQETAPSKPVADQDEQMDAGTAGTIPSAVQPANAI